MIDSSSEPRLRAELSSASGFRRNDNPQIHKQLPTSPVPTLRTNHKLTRGLESRDVSPSPETSPRRCPSPPRTKLPGINGPSGSSSQPSRASWSAPTSLSTTSPPHSYATSIRGGSPGSSTGPPLSGGTRPGSNSNPGVGNSQLSAVYSSSSSSYWPRSGPLPLPPYLTFESYWNEGRARVMVTIQYNTATHICTAHTSIAVAARVAPAYSQAHVNPWDLHVGAVLTLLGRKITLRKARDQATIQWLDQQARQLLKEKAVLEEALRKYRLVASSWPKRRGGRCEPLDLQAHMAVPLGGRVNLRNLRDDIIDLARALRQHQISLPDLPSVHLVSSTAPVHPVQHQGPGTTSGVQGYSTSPTPPPPAFAGEGTFQTTHTTHDGGVLYPLPANLLPYDQPSESNGCGGQTGAGASGRDDASSLEFAEGTSYNQGKQVAGTHGQPGVGFVTATGHDLSVQGPGDIGPAEPAGRHSIDPAAAGEFRAQDAAGCAPRAVFTDPYSIHAHSSPGLHDTGWAGGGVGPVRSNTSAGGVGMGGEGSGNTAAVHSSQSAGGTAVAVHDMELDVVVVEGPEDWSLERRLAAQAAREEEERRRAKAEAEAAAAEAERRARQDLMDWLGSIPLAASAAHMEKRGSVYVDPLKASQARKEEGDHARQLQQQPGAGQWGRRGSALALDLSYYQKVAAEHGVPVPSRLNSGELAAHGADRVGHGPKSGISGLATVSEAGFEDRDRPSRMPTSDLTDQYAYANNPRRSPRTRGYSNVTRSSHSGEAAPHTNGGLPGASSMQRAGALASPSMQHGSNYPRAPSGLRSSMEAGLTGVGGHVVPSAGTAHAPQSPPHPPHAPHPASPLVRAGSVESSMQHQQLHGGAHSNPQQQQQQQGSSMQSTPSMNRSCTQGSVGEAGQSSVRRSDQAQLESVTEGPME